MSEPHAFRLPIRLALLAVLLASTACAIGPKYARPPALTATYCVPSCSNVIGAPEMSPFNRVCHNSWPVSECSAKNWRSAVPPNTMPPLVASADAVIGAPLGGR